MRRTAEERRYIARKAARASARRRREHADPSRRRSYQRRLALTFRVKVIDREEFGRRDFARRVRAGIAPNERGTETLWQEYCSCVRAFKAQGQGFYTTNGQRAQALAKRGRPRCERTVQRAHAALHDMGLLRRFHDRRGKATPGNKDRLRVQFAPAFVTPPSAAPAAEQSSTAAGAFGLSAGTDCAPAGRREDPPVAEERSGAPPGGDTELLAPAAPANSSDEEEGANRGGAPQDLDAAVEEARRRLESLRERRHPEGAP